MKYKDILQAETMRKHIEACKESKQTITVYCKEHGLAASTFYYWQKRLGGGLSQEPGFTQLSPLPIDMSAVTICYPNGVRIEFGVGVSPSSLKELVCFI